MEYQDLFLSARSLVQGLRENEQLPLFLLSQELVDGTAKPTDLRALLRSIKEPLPHSHMFVNIFLQCPKKTVY